VFLHFKSAFVSAIKAHLSTDSNNSHCTKVQHISTTNLLHIPKVIPKNLAIWPSTHCAGCIKC